MSNHLRRQRNEDTKRRLNEPIPPDKLDRTLLDRFPLDEFNEVWEAMNKQKEEKHGG